LGVASTRAKPTTGCYRLGLGLVISKNCDTDVA